MLLYCLIYNCVLFLMYLYSSFETNSTANFSISLPKFGLFITPTFDILFLFSIVLGFPQAFQIVNEKSSGSMLYANGKLNIKLKTDIR